MLCVDQAISTAFLDVYDGVKHLLCRWHIDR